jgi:hypothetical protein
MVTAFIKEVALISLLFQHGSLDGQRRTQATRPKDANLATAEYSMRQCCCCVSQSLSNVKSSQIHEV